MSLFESCVGANLLLKASPSLLNIEMLCSSCRKLAQRDVGPVGLVPRRKFDPAYPRLRQSFCRASASSRPKIAQEWSAERYQQHCFVPELGRDLLQLLEAGPGQKIIDVGCGDGLLTAQIQAAGAEVLGLDASEALLAVAKRRGIKTLQLDAHELASVAGELGQFDKAFSNAALHWMLDLGKVLKGVYASLRPGGRFVAEMGGHGNVASVFGPLRKALAQRGHEIDAYNPWVFPTAEEASGLLSSCGFEVKMIKLFDRPTPLPHGFCAWLQTFANAFLDHLPSDEQAQVLHEVTAAWQADPEHQQRRLDHGGGQQWVLDYVRLQFVATKPN